MAKKYGRALMGLLVVGGVGYVGWHMKTHDGKLPWEENLRRTVVLPAGTSVELILLEGLEAGASEVGSTVDMAVAKDVLADGAVVIRRGDKAHGEVKGSRGGSLAATLAGKGPLLSVTVTEIVLADGRKVPIQFGQGTAHAFTQKNTADRAGAPNIDKLWSNPDTRKSLEKLAKSFASGKPLDESHTELAALVASLGLAKTAKATSGSPEGKGITVGKVFDAVSTGRLTTLAGVDAVAAAESVGEIAALAASVDNKMVGALLGRKLRATIGTTLVVKTKTKVEQTVWLGPGGKPLLSR